MLAQQQAHKNHIPNVLQVVNNGFDRLWERNNAGVCGVSGVRGVSDPHAAEDREHPLIPPLPPEIMETLGATAGSIWW